jgi:hypothetical protein
MVRPGVVLVAVCMLGFACSGSSSAPPPKPADQPAPAPAAGSPAPAASQTPAATSPAAAAPESKSPDAAAPKPDAPKPDAPKPDAPKAPEFREVTIPAGQTISVTLTTSIASDTSKVEDPVRGKVAKPIVISGVTAVPAGSEASGSVTEALESGRVKGRASIAFRFARLVVRDEPHDIRTARITRQAAPSGRDDLKKGGIGAGVGAVVGGIVGGKKGAVIGAGAGGAGTVLATKGKEVRLPAGTIVTTTLQEALKVRVPAGER